MKGAHHTAIVTGAGTGIGRAVALALAAHGFDLALTGRRKPPLEEVASGVRAAGANAHVIPGDVTDLGHVRALVREAADALGRIDVLVNSAGINTPKRRLDEIDVETWDRVIEINLSGTYYVTREVLPLMRAAGGGLIVNVISGSGLVARDYAGAAYTAAKHGVAGLSRSVNAEEWRHGIRCTAIYPGEVETAMLDSDYQRLQPGEQDMVLQPEDVAAAVMLAVRLPARALLSDLVIRPTRGRHR